MIMKPIVILCISVGLIHYGLSTYQERKKSKARSINDNIRRETLVFLYEFVMGKCRKHGVIPFLNYGTLLGQYRENDMIQWDYDIDLGILSNEYEILKTSLRQEVNDYNKEFGDRILKFENNQFEKKLVISHTKRQLHYDIYSYKRDTEQDRITLNIPELFVKFDSAYHDCQTSYPLDQFVPFKNVIFLGKLVHVPNKSDKVLECQYGPDYMTPKRN